MIESPLKPQRKAQVGREKKVIPPFESALKPLVHSNTPKATPFAKSTLPAIKVKRLISGESIL